MDLNDELYQQAKELAARTGRALKDIVEDALRLAFRPPEPRPAERVNLPQSSAIPGLRPGVDLDSSVALLDLMEEPDAAS